jgi:hypothetical protein
MKQMNSEVKKDVVDGETKRLKMRWVKVRPNHLWDCEAMQVACAMIFGIIKTELPSEAKVDNTENA